MISIIIAILIGIGTFFGLQRTFEDLNIVWISIFAVVASIVVQVVIGLIFRKKVTGVTNEIQSVIMEGQQKLQRKINMFQNKPAGGYKHMQKLLEKDQEVFLRDALSLISKLNPFFLWVPMLSKQANTMRMQFHYQLGEMDKVDELLPKCLYMDPLTVGMKMAREYKNDDPKLEKTFKSKIKKFKGDQSAILYGIYSWILVKKGNKDKAFEVLTEAKNKTDNETIQRNWDALANDKVKQFSNAGFGEEWYSLKLEQPKAPKQKMQKRFK